MGRASLLGDGQFGLRGVRDLPSTWVVVSQQHYLPMLSPVLKFAQESGILWLLFPLHHLSAPTRGVLGHV